MTAPAVERQEPRARALWYVGKRHGRIAQHAPLPPLGAGRGARPHRCSAASAAAPSAWSSRAGSPPSEQERMRAPMQEGDFPFPVKYGYCASGIVEDGPRDLVGRDGVLPASAPGSLRRAGRRLVLVPDGVPARRAVLAANMETALNALWDSRRRAGRPHRRGRRRRGRAAGRRPWRRGCPARRSRWSTSTGARRDRRAARRAVRRSRCDAPRRRRRRVPRQRHRGRPRTAPRPAPASRRRSSR